MTSAWETGQAATLRHLQATTKPTSTDSLEKQTSSYAKVLPALASYF